MRIYEVKVEHKKFGRNYDNLRVSAESFNQAIRKAKSLLKTVERIESVELIAATD
jgi:hypothetical protein